jgi:hypothetical protein
MRAKPHAKRAKQATKRCVRCSASRALSVCLTVVSICMCVLFECVQGRAQQKAITEHQKYTNLVSKCNLCYTSAHLLKHLVVSLGLKFYLSLPATRRITDQHCLLVPTEHVTAVTALDEDAYEEYNVCFCCCCVGGVVLSCCVDTLCCVVLCCAGVAQYFRKHLVKMFAAQKRGVVFMETVTNIKKQRHLTVECVPLPMEQFQDANIYFKVCVL